MRLLGLLRRNILLILFVVYLGLVSCATTITAHFNGAFLEPFLTRPITIQITSDQELLEKDFGHATFFTDTYNSDQHSQAIPSHILKTNIRNQFTLDSNKFFNFLEITSKDKDAAISGISLLPDTPFEKSIQENRTLYRLSGVSNHSFNGKIRTALNYQGDAYVVHLLPKILASSLKEIMDSGKILLFFILAFVIFFLSWIAKKIPTIPKQLITQKLPWYLGDITLLVAAVTALFFTLEYTLPFRFTVGDNYYNFLPLMRAGNTILFSGHLPFLNVYQYLGSPLLETGVLAFLYPLNILAYAISIFLLNNTFLFFDVFAFLHLLLGAVMMHALLRKYGITRLLAGCASLSYVFSAYAIQIGGMWYYIMPFIVAIPLLFLLHEMSIFERPSARGIWILGFIRAVFFYAGNAQYFLYLCSFEFCNLIIRCFQDNHWLPRIQRYSVSLVVTLIIIAPLAVAQFETLHNAQRAGGEGFMSAALKYLRFQGKDPLSFFTTSIIPIPVSSFDQSSYVGFPFFLAMLLGWCAVLRKRSLGGTSPYLLLALIATLLSFGPAGGVYALGAAVPVLNTLYHPWKFTLFIAAFCIISSSTVLNNIFTILPYRRVKKVFYASLGFLGIAAFVVHLFAVQQQRFMNANINISEAQDLGTAEAYARLDGRVYTHLIEDADTPCSTSLTDAKNLAYNHASSYAIFHFSGFEPFSSKATIKRTILSPDSDPLPYLGNYGVKWIVSQICSPEKTPSRLTASLKTLKPTADTGAVRIYQNPFVKPLVFEEQKETPLSYAVVANGIQFESAAKHTTSVVVNFLFRKGYQATVDGTTHIPLTQDSFERMRVEVPAGNHRVTVVYRNQLFLILAQWSFLLLVTLGILQVLLVVRRRAPSNIRYRK